MIRKSNRKKVTHCNLSEITLSLGFNDDFTLLVHAPKACSGLIYNTLCNTRRRIVMKYGNYNRDGTAKVYFTGIGSQEVIFGGERLLEASIRTLVEEQSPKCLIVVSGCVASVIGDDTEAVCKELEKVFQIPIIFIPGAGFMSNQGEEGLLSTTRAVYRKFRNPTLVRDPSTFTLLGLKGFYMAEPVKQELLRLFGYFGFKKLLSPPCSLGLEEFKQLSTSSLITLNSLMPSKLKAYRAFASEMARDLQIPVMEETLPLTPEATFNYLLGLGKVLGKEEEAQSVVKIEKQRWQEALVKGIQVLRGKPCVVAYGFNPDFSGGPELLELVLSLGMQTQAILLLEELTTKQVEQYKKIFANKGIPIIEEAEFVCYKTVNTLYITSEHKTYFPRQLVYKRIRIGVGGWCRLVQAIVEMEEKGRLLRYE